MPTTQNSKPKTQNRCSTSPEEQLIILSAQLHLDDQTTRTIENILTGHHTAEHLKPHESTNSKPKTQNPKLFLNWNHILTTTHRLGGQPLLYKHLSNPQWRNTVPAHVHQTLKDAYRKSAFKNLIIQGQIKQIANQAAANQIPLIFLKGAALAGSLYPDIALRPMGDIDFLCREEDIPKVDEMLLDLGYSQNFDRLRSSIHTLISNEDDKHLTPYMRKNGVPLEVHKRLFGKNFCEQMNMKPVWIEALKTKNVANGLQRLNHEWMLLHLCMHLHQHLKNGTFTLYWISDIVAYVSRYSNQLNWEKLWQLAGGFAAQEKMRDVLTLINTHCGITVPEFVLHDAAPGLQFLMDTEASDAIKYDHLIEDRVSELRGIFSKYGLTATVSFWIRKLLPKKAYISNKYGEPSRLKFVYCYLRHIYEVLRYATIGIRMSLWKNTNPSRSH